ncbi:MAG: FtsX-like permease family protein [Pseudomonadota bacterium]
MPRLPAALLAAFSWQELRHHPWRNAAAVLAVMLGVALAFSVHLINASALSEFASGVRSAGGQPDLELRAAQGGFDEALYARVANHPDVALAAPVLELQTLAPAANGERRSLRVLGIDALLVAGLAPDLLPVPSAQADRLAMLLPDTVFLNPAARQAFAGDTLRLQVGLQLRTLQIAGTVAAAGAPLAVMDIAAAQELFGRIGELSRIDLRLRPGTSHADFLASLRLPPGVTAAEPGDAGQRVDELSRAYRVNLTVLALVALFTGAFLVFSVLALSVARRAQQFALLGVLGLTAGERRGIVLAESLLLGALGSVLGVALGSALAALALRVLGGDLGGGYFPGVAPRLQWSSGAAAVYGGLGVVAAAAGGWLPARLAQRLPLAQTLKGLGTSLPAARGHRLSLLLIAAAGGFALLPPIAGIPLAAYLSVGFLLVGGIGVLPWAVALLYDRLAPHVANRLLPMLAVERARRVRESAAVAISGVVAALGLAVALTVMVASFRESVTRWLDVVLPADLYLRTANSAASSDSAFFTPEFVQGVARLPGVERVNTQRLRSLLLAPAHPPVALLARRIEAPERSLPLVAGPLPAPAGQIPVYVSEAVVDLYGARVGTPLPALSQAFAPAQTFFVAGVWRDYVRQSGAVMLDARDYQRLTGDLRTNEIHLWLAPGADAAEVQGRIRALAAQQAGAGGLVEIASAAELRAVSLRIFDRSFAVTYWLQAVAIAIGLFGVAASFSAQILARRKEFGLLAHLGLTRRQILGVVAGEGAAWTVIGSLAGLALGLGVAVVLVHVVNPQSFHWTMDLLVPWLRLALLCVAVVAAGMATAWLAGRAAAGRDAVLAVKEDW